MSDSLKCPNCGYHEYETVQLKSDQFKLDLMRCYSCDSLFSEEHGYVEIVKKELTCSFL